MNEGRSMSLEWRPPGGPMDVQVRLGAGLSRLVGRSQLVLDLPSDATVGDVVAVLGDSYPSLASHAQRALAVVDGSQVGQGRPLTEGEKVALLLPAAGG